MSPLFDLTGKVAVVTGSSRGIGQAIALRLAEHGAKVVVSSRNQGACEAVVAEIDAAHGPGRAAAIECNIASKDALAALVAGARERFGQVDVLVCNAASNPHYGPMSTLTDDAFQKVLQNNIVSNHWLIQMVAPEMVERRDGSIIIISSIGGLKGSLAIGAYNISKAADFQLARNLAVEFGPHNVRVNCIAPGIIKTEFARALWEDPAVMKRIHSGAPMRRIGEPDEIAGAAVYLASPASAFMTGQSLVIDGGTTIA